MIAHQSAHLLKRFSGCAASFQNADDLLKLVVARSALLSAVVAKELMFCARERRRTGGRADQRAEVRHDINIRVRVPELPTLAFARKAETDEFMELLGFTPSQG